MDVVTGRVGLERRDARRLPARAQVRELRLEIDAVDVRERREHAEAGPRTRSPARVAPRAARLAASNPACAAAPACTGLVSEPSARYSKMPLARLPAIAERLRVSLGARPCRRAAAIAAPNTPHTTFG